MVMLANHIAFHLDPVLFARDALGFTPDPWQRQVLRWVGKRLILNCSRQSGKSTVAAILSVHTALYMQGSLTILVSPSLRQSGELFKKVQELLQKLDNRPKLVEDNRLSLQLANGSRVVSIPCQENTVRGFSGVDLIVEDEASRVTDDLYKSVRPMLAVSGGRLILMSTPFGKRGHFYQEWDKGRGWEQVQITAPECPRISAEFLEEERESLGEWWYSQEYMCEFRESQDSVFSYEEVMQAMSADVLPLGASNGFGAIDPDITPLSPDGVIS